MGQVAAFLGFSSELSEATAEPRAFLSTLANLAGEWFLLAAASPPQPPPAAALRALPSAAGAQPAELRREGRTKAGGRGLLLLEPSNTSAAARYVSAASSECPQDESDCVFQCIASGFATELFGSTILFVSRYDDNACDCKKVFPLSAATAETAYLVGQVSPPQRMFHLCFNHKALYTRSLLRCA